MAQLVAIGGALIGGAIGGPAGARAGYLVGSIAGNFIFREKQPDTQNEGPRLGDLTITTSAYGLTIPIVYGTVRVPGNVIWSKGIEEVKNTHTVQRGGKGGGGSTHTEITYTYFCTYAVGLCEGEVGQILRIWADSKIIYDITGKSGGDAKKHSLNFRFYPGSETQIPDSLIEDDKGAGDTPAFRGLAYVVFDRMPLADFGNRLPNLSFEVTKKFKDEVFRKTLKLPNLEYTANLVRDLRRRQAYISDHTNLFVVNLRDFTFLRSKKYSDMGFDVLGSYPKPQIVTDTGYILLITESGNVPKFGLIDAQTLTKTDELSTGSYKTRPYFVDESDSQPFTTIVTPTGIKTYVYLTPLVKNYPPNFLELKDGKINRLGWNRSFSFTYPAGTKLKLACSGRPGEFYEIRGNDTTFYLFRITIDEGVFFDERTFLTTGISLQKIKEYNVGNFKSAGTTSENFYGWSLHNLLFDKTDNSLIILPRAVNALAPEGKIIKISTTDGRVLWREAPNPEMGTILYAYKMTTVEDGTLAYLSYKWRGGEEKNIHVIRTSDGREFFKQNIQPDDISTNQYFYDASLKSLISLYPDDNDDLVKISLFKGSGESSDLSSIVSDLTLKSDLKAEDFNVTGLDGEKVPGYVIARQTTIRAALETLTGAYFFDGIESDFVLKYQPRQGKVVSKTLNEDDLVFLDTKTGVIKETKKQEVELPLKFSVTYQNKERDYQQSTHSASRSTAILGGTKSINHHSVSLPLALEPDFSKQLAEKLLYISWIERSSFSFKQNIEHVDLDPGDLFKISMDDGTVFQLRAESSQMGPDLSIESEAVSELPTQYVSNVKADSGDSGIVHEFLSSLDTNLFLLDVPLLRDGDSRAREVSQMYFFMAGYGGTGWKNGNLYMSSDKTNYKDVGLALEETPWGRLLNVLPRPDSLWSTDTKNEVHVSMIAGEDELSSTSFDDMLNGANAAALLRPHGIELFQFQNAVQQDDGTFILKNLLRGRRGTDVYTDAPEGETGDIFLLLKARAGGLLSFPLDEKGQTRYFKPVLDEGFIEDAPVFQKKLSFNDLKPWSVAQVKAQKRSYNNDIEISWTRRTRIGGGLRDDTGEVPLGEDEEKYEVDILKDDDSVLRTFTGLTREEVAYDVSQQKTDGFDRSQNKIRVKIYQMSKQAGRGFAEVLSLSF